MLKIAISTLLTLNTFFQCQRPAQPVAPIVIAGLNNQNNAAPAKIQVALLLDTSNSMDGLIDQAKAQLWKMVNRLAAAKKQNQDAELEIALFEYGNSGLSAESGYIRLVQPLGKDLDRLSEKLFELRTNGGDEYCGWVIQSAQEMLPWSADAGCLKIIIIAGNEPFDQGRINFRNSCARAIQNDIIINTIHCGDYQTGVDTYWKEGATIGNGRYLNIDTDQKVVHVPTPYDGKVLELNEKLNRTYLGYGAHGSEGKERQMAQDRNAAEYGAANTAQRAAAKSKASYSNEEWDLVDAAKSDKELSKKLRDEDLPAELRGKKPEEVEKEIQRLGAEREAIQTELRDLEKKMQEFIAEESKKQSATQTLDNVLIETVVNQAKAKGFDL